MAIYSYRIEVFLPRQPRIAKKKKKNARAKGAALGDDLVTIKDEVRLFSFVIPGWVSANGPREAKRHAELMGRGMLLGSRYKESEDVYQLKLELAPRTKRWVYWAVTGIRECKEGIHVQNAYGMESVQLVPQPPQEPHPFLQSFQRIQHPVLARAGGSSL